MSDTSEHAALQRDVGRLEGKVDAQGAQLVAMDTKLAVVVAYIEQQKGSDRAMARTGTLAGSIAGAVFGAVVAWFTR